MPPGLLEVLFGVQVGKLHRLKNEDLGWQVEAQPAMYADLPGCNEILAHFRSNEAELV